MSFVVEHTRVRLQGSKCPSSNSLGRRGNNAKNGEEFINANFVDGSDRCRAYIATQGPTLTQQGSGGSGLTLFWRMIWEQKAKVVVMMCNRVEAGQVKMK